MVKNWIWAIVLTIGLIFAVYLVDIVNHVFDDTACTFGFLVGFMIYIVTYAVSAQLSVHTTILKIFAIGVFILLLPIFYIQPIAFGILWLTLTFGLFFLAVRSVEVIKQAITVENGPPLKGGDR